MDRKINIRHLIYEFVNKVKLIVIVSVLFALLFSGYSVFTLKQQIAAQVFGAYGELYVEYILNEDDLLINTDNVQAISGFNDPESFSSYILPMITSNEILNDVINDEDVKGLDITKEELSSMVYPDVDKNGKIIRLNVVNQNESVAIMVCGKMLEYGQKYYTAKGFYSEIRKDASMIGPVYVQTKDSTTKQGDKISIVTSIPQVTLSIIGLLKKALLGFVFGIFTCLVLISIRFIIKDRIVYAEQVEENTDVNLLAKCTNNKGYEDLYTRLLLMNREFRTIQFMSLKQSNNNDFLFHLAERIGKNGKACLVIKNKSGVSDEDFKISKLEDYDFGELHDNIIFDCDGFKGLLSSLKEKYDYIMYQGDSVDANPVAKLVATEVDETVILLEPNTVKVDELQNVKVLFDELNLNLSGAVFWDNRKN